MPEKPARCNSADVPIHAGAGIASRSIHPRLVPGSPLHAATRYALNKEEAWRRCFSDGRLEIDNREVERRLRRVALERKNYLFAGSDKGRSTTGHRVYPLQLVPSPWRQSAGLGDGRPRQAAGRLAARSLGGAVAGCVGQLDLTGAGGAGRSGLSRNARRRRARTALREQSSLPGARTAGNAPRGWRWLGGYSAPPHRKRGWSPRRAHRAGASG